jgi:hypothetical protein
MRKQLFDDIHSSGKTEAPRVFAYLILKPSYAYEIAKTLFGRPKRLPSKLAVLLNEMQKKDYLLKYVTKEQGRIRKYYKANPTFLKSIFTLEGLGVLLDTIAKLGSSEVALTIIKSLGVKHRRRKRRYLDPLTLVIFIADVFLEFIEGYSYFRWELEEDFLCGELGEFAEEFQDIEMRYDPYVPPSKPEGKTYLNWDNTAVLKDAKLIDRLDDVVWNYWRRHVDELAPTLEEEIKENLNNFLREEYKQRGILGWVF